MGLAGDKKHGLFQSSLNRFWAKSENKEPGLSFLEYFDVMTIGLAFA
jgi:hypothetical protein